MARFFVAFACGMVLLGGCSGAEDVAPAFVEVGSTTPAQLLTAGPPTFVLGTAGDDVSDRGIATQVALLRGFLADPGTVVADRDVEALPERAVLYGTPAQNAAVPAGLPLEVSAEALTIGGESFQGPGIAVAAVVPGDPEFLLYAGTGPAGVAEINARSSGNEQIVVADAFGTVTTGRWVADGDGVRAHLGPSARRIAWRAVERALGGSGLLRMQFPAQLPAAPDEGAVVDAAERGTRRVVETLEIAEPVPVDVYVYPDRRSKESLTGNGGDGHAVVAASALHVLVTDDGEGGPLESLVAHEVTHLLGYHAWGPAATPLLAEGLAVWVAGQYGGIPLDAWAGTLPAPPPVASLLPGRAFRQAPEAETYPLAGLLVEVAVELVGPEGVRQLLGATAETWEQRCRAAGTTAEELDEALAARIG